MREMVRSWPRICAGVGLVWTVALQAQMPASRLNPAIERIVADIAEQRIAANLRRLEAFETRHVMSEQDHPIRGIGAAKRWISDEFKGYSPRLQVSFQDFRVREGARRGEVFREVE